MPSTRASLARLLLLVALLAAAGVVALAVPVPDLATVREAVDDAGVLAPVGFVLAYAAATLAPVPKSVLTVAAGALFGLVSGAGLVVLSATLGALVAYGVGRLLGRDAVERLTGARVARLDDLLERRGLVAVIGLRLVPVVPFTVMNYAAGLTRVRTRDFLIGTPVGLLPGTLTYVSVGALGADLGRAPLAVSVLMIGLGAVALLVVRSRRPAAVSPGRGPRP